jgi:hypothetical protein
VLRKTYNAKMLLFFLSYKRKEKKINNRKMFQVGKPIGKTNTN